MTGVMGLEGEEVECGVVGRLRREGWGIEGVDR